MTSCLRTADDYELIAYECGEGLARQNCRYAEVTFSPCTHDTLGMPHEACFAGLTRGRERPRADFGIESAWVFDIVRGGGAARADYTTSVAIEGRDDGVVALGLGGVEVGHRPEPYAPSFARARAAGLRGVPHAGETVGPESVWGALRALGAERLGHGVRAIEDPALVAHLAEQRIPLEVCPTSNVRLGVYPDYTAHPFARLHAAGVVVTVSSDDPPLFHTTLNDEMALLAGPFGFDLAAADAILLNAVRHCFLPPKRREALEAAFKVEPAALETGLPHRQ